MPKAEFERNVETGKDIYRVGSCFLPKLEFDVVSATDEQRNQDHTGARFLCAAVLACYCNTFANALRREGAEVKFVKATAGTWEEQDMTKRTIYSGMIIDVELGLADKDKEIFSDVEEEMLHGSLLTYSLEAGMDVDYNLHMTIVKNAYPYFRTAYRKRIGTH